MQPYPQQLYMGAKPSIQETTGYGGYIPESSMLPANSYPNSEVKYAQHKFYKLLFLSINRFY